MTRAELTRHALSAGTHAITSCASAFLRKALLFVLIIDVFLVQQRQNGLGI